MFIYLSSYFVIFIILLEIILIINIFYIYLLFSELNVYFSIFHT